MDRKLRVAVLVRCCDVRGGGAERYAVALIEQLAGTHEIHVFAQHIHHHWPGVTYHRVGMLARRPRWLNQLHFAWQTWWLTRRGFDVVHSHELTWHGQVQTVHVQPVVHGMLAQRAGWRSGLRRLGVVLSLRKLAYWWLERRRMRSARLVVATSEALAQQVRTWYPATAQALRVVLPGVDSTPGLADQQARARARQIMGLSSDGIHLLFVANDFIRKGLETLLVALQRLPDSVRLMVVGDGAHRNAMEQRVRDLGLHARVHFLGSCADMPSVYRAADVLVHPTREDSFGMVVLEAMAHGLPVVVSAAPFCGIAELLHDGAEARLLQDPRSTDGLARALAGLLDDAALRVRLSACGLAFAQSHLWSDSAAAMSRIYAEAMATGSAP